MSCRRTDWTDGIDNAGAMSDGEHISRRSALKKGAMLGTAALVIPTVTTLSMDKAFAQGTNGGRPGRGGNNNGQGGNNNNQ